MTSHDQMKRLEAILEKLDLEDRAFISSLIEKDPLTGVYNRRKFDMDIELLISMADRTNRGTSLLMIDIDHFKRYNDTYGHHKGDAILRAVTESIEKSLRDYDKIYIYRFGGEEFVVLLPDIPEKAAFKIGERLRKNVKGHCGVTVSIGVSHYKESAEDLQTLIKNADKAMYAAKQNGRDRVEIYDSKLHAEGSPDQR
jgi:diguanylate cyclase (GGDEF)-like protein